MIDISEKDSIRTITINLPERKNAIPPQGWKILHDAFRDFEKSDNRVLIITGAGGAFCSGADLIQDPEELSTLQTVAGRYDRMQIVGSAAEALHQLSKPTIAAVAGIAAGAGLSLALGCDVVVAATTAQFAALFVQRGLVVDFGGTWLLPRLVGLQHAKEISLSGRLVPADEAFEMGMVTRLVEPESLEVTARDMAVGFLSGGPLAQGLIKAGMNESMNMSFRQSVAFEANAQTICLGSQDAAEGISAFLQKRKPTFRGR
jgi:2-(1,2-epoxy-1,2-dihydrophenyl)acetyl-CoA isomerase